MISKIQLGSVNLDRGQLETFRLGTVCARSKQTHHSPTFQTRFPVRNKRWTFNRWNSKLNGDLSRIVRPSFAFTPTVVDYSVYYRVQPAVKNRPSTLSANVYANTFRFVNIILLCFLFTHKSLNSSKTRIVKKIKIIWQRMSSQHRSKSTDV